MEITPYTKFIIEGDNGVYSTTGTSISKVSTISEYQSKNPGTDLPTISSTEAEQVFQDILDAGSRRYDGQYVNEYSDKIVKASEIADYLGREPLGTLPTRAEELAGNVTGLTSGSALNRARLQQSTSTQTSQQTSQVSLQQALQEVYSKRTDLQSLYNPDGSAKDPNDPRIAGISTLQEWAQKYGINEEPSLQNAVNSASVPANLTGPYAELYKQLKGQLDALQKKGQVINPNVQITPQKLGEFMSQAAKEIDPFYASQLKIAKDSFLTSIGYSKDQILREEAEVERQYGTQVRNIGENAAEQGFAQSGRRKLDEQNLATDTQNQIDSGRRSLSYQAGQSARQFAQQYGSSSLTNPTLSGAPRVLAGQSAFEKSGGENPFYQLSPEVYQGLVGSQQYEQDASKRRRASELEEAYRTQQGISQQRALIL